MRSSRLTASSLFALALACAACGGPDPTTAEGRRALTVSPAQRSEDLGGVLDPPSVTPLCEVEACDEACAALGASLGTPAFGECAAAGCTCRAFIWPPSGGGGGGGPRGCQRTGCPHDQHCDLSGACVPNLVPCDDAGYALEHVCECVPELNCG